MDNPIGVFDSGVGGLTVVNELIRQLPLENIVYFGDTARVPYGPRSQSEVKDFVFEIISFLISRQVKLVVIACNTATAAGLAQAQAHFDVPIVGVIEPGARGAVQATKNRRIGVIGTAGTINSAAYTQAIRALDAGVTVYSATCPKFVEVVEKGMISDANFLRPKTYNLAKTYLTPLLRAGIDSMILGCTHYPLLKDLLGKVAGGEVALISSAEETAMEVKAILERRGQLREGPDLPIHRFVATLETDQFAALGSRFLGRKITEVEFIDLKADTSVEIS
ncbi:MAG: glutamate racemase [Actinomycetota bacterium]|nr:glutamate racemase [Actinomycetota bacterium]